MTSKNIQASLRMRPEMKAALRASAKKQSELSNCFIGFEKHCRHILEDWLIKNTDYGKKEGAN
jgi:hypothetical protein